MRLSTVSEKINEATFGKNEVKVDIFCSGIIKEVKWTDGYRQERIDNFVPRFVDTASKALEADYNNTTIKYLSGKIQTVKGNETVAINIIVSIYPMQDEAYLTRLEDYLVQALERSMLTGKAIKHFSKIV